mmetsp:Transcript_88440/g.211133  ORF Transcript_88440/g.211133 Transcript_88440/m.211133 type:complete len:277 (+) Transcript_88440:3094-3924(+)
MRHIAHVGRDDREAVQKEQPYVLRFLLSTLHQEVVKGQEISHPAPPAVCLQDALRHALRQVALRKVSGGQAPCRVRHGTAIKIIAPRWLAGKSVARIRRILQEGGTLRIALLVGRDSHFQLLQLNWHPHACGPRSGGTDHHRAQRGGEKEHHDRAQAAHVEGLLVPRRRGHTPLQQAPHLLNHRAAWIGHHKARSLWLVVNLLHRCLEGRLCLDFLLLVAMLAAGDLEEHLLQVGHGHAKGRHRESRLLLRESHQAGGELLLQVHGDIHQQLLPDA